MPPSSPPSTAHPSATVDFRPMEPRDLSLAEEWLTKPHVQPWWKLDDLAEIHRALDGDEPVEPWILVVDGRDAGYFQVYDVGADEDYAIACATVGVHPGTAGIDYLVGEAHLTRVGIGTRAIARFVADIVFGRRAWPAVCAGPDPENRASIRVLEKNGFRLAGAICTTEGPEHLMLLTHDRWARLGSAFEQEPVAVARDVRTDRGE
jgi:RimJ/RimL family protein N-acetyltransferase